MNNFNNLSELTARIIAGVLGDTSMPGPEVTFLRARVLGQRDSRTSGEINAAYSVGGVGRWPVWDTRPELTPFEAEWFRLRAKSSISESEIIFLANRHKMSISEIEKFSTKVNRNLLDFAKQSRYTPIVGLVPEQKGHFLFDNPYNLIGMLSNWGLPSFSIRKEEISERPWSALVRFGVIVPDILITLIKDATFFIAVGSSLSNQDVIGILESRTDYAQDRESLTVYLEDNDTYQSSGWGEYENRLLLNYQAQVQSLPNLSYQLA